MCVMTYQSYQRGIETGDVGLGIEFPVTINRTSVELKHACKFTAMKYSHYQSYQRGIETVTKAAHQAYPSAINRTSVELKHLATRPIPGWEYSINRTSVELKPVKPVPSL